MPRVAEFKDPDYDRRLAEFKAMRDQAKKEMGEQKPAVKKDVSSMRIFKD